MITFTKYEDNRQFITIVINDGTSTEKVLDFLEAFYPTIKAHLFKRDREEITLNLVNDVDYGFKNLNELRDTVKHIAQAVIYTFTVDTNGQRYSG